jgi:hypothetical protein
MLNGVTKCYKPTKYSMFVQFFDSPVVDFPRKAVEIIDSAHQLVTSPMAFYGRKCHQFFVGAMVFIHFYTSSYSFQSCESVRSPHGNITVVNPMFLFQKRGKFHQSGYFLTDPVGQSVLLRCHWVIWVRPTRDDWCQQKRRPWENTGSNVHRWILGCLTSLISSFYFWKA